MSNGQKFEVILSKTAFKYYRRVDRKIARRLDYAFLHLERNPWGEADIKPLQGVENKYRLRVGSLRVIYGIDIEHRQVRVFAILPRGQAYK